MTTNRYRYAIIGTGRPHGSEGATGFGMAHPHYKGFQASGRVDLVAVADIDEGHARAFLADYNEDAKIYNDYHDMLRDRKARHRQHHDLAAPACGNDDCGLRSGRAGRPLREADGDDLGRRQTDEGGGRCQRNHPDVQPSAPLSRTVPEGRADHSRAGDLGELQRIEAQCGDMFDWGTHWLDMMQFFNEETPMEWVIGQIDSRKDNIVFGAPMENQAICHYKWTNGVRGLMVAGYEAKWDCAIRVTGTEGTLEVLWE